MGDLIADNATKHEVKRKRRIIILIISTIVIVLAAGGFWALSGVHKMPHPSNSAQDTAVSSSKTSEENTGVAGSSPNNTTAPSEKGGSVEVAPQNTGTSAKTGDVSAGGQSASESKPNSTSSSSSKPSSGSGASSSSSGGSSPSKVWVPPVTKVVHHDAVYKTEPVYSEVAYEVCNNCGYKTTNDDDMWAHLKSTRHAGWHEEDVQVQTGTKQVLITAAWDETVIVTPGHWE